MTKKLPVRALCERYAISERTIDRWIEAGILPPPVYINHRRYFDEAELEERERERMARRGEAMRPLGEAVKRVVDRIDPAKRGGV
jgi:DNA-binding transcriptional MerR regulator